MRRAPNAGVMDLGLLHIWQLAPNIREHDLADMKTEGMTAEDALFYGHASGRSWGVVWEDRCIGAGGFTDEGAIWSLWADLTPEQSRWVLSQASFWAQIIREKAGPNKWLWNVYLQGNRLSETFLRATHCVNIDKEHPIEHEGRVFIPFHLKSAEELSRV